jgi:glycosyltransferase involved in cell wall biosynthesis
MRLSLVIPCYDEAASLPELIARCTALAEAGGIEVILVDNGSRDSTPRILEQLPKDGPVRALRLPENRGYGGGIIAGLAEAKGEIIGYTHADLQADPADALKALAQFESGPALVKGKRVGRRWSEALFSLGMAGFESLLFGRIFSEVNAQPTLFPRDFLGRLAEPPRDWGLDLYIYLAALRERLPLRRVEVRFPPRRHGQSHWNTGWSARWRFIRRVIGYSWKLRRRG